MGQAWAVGPRWSNSRRLGAQGSLSLSPPLRSALTPPADLFSFAYVKHKSNYAHEGGLETEDETERYKQECVALYKELLGADEVIAWCALFPALDMSSASSFLDAPGPSRPLSTAVLL